MLRIVCLMLVVGQAAGFLAPAGLPLRASASQPPRSSSKAVSSLQVSEVGMDEGAG